MEIRVLRYFLAVAREGNITAAANFLHLTQPTLSRQIKDLETELGTQLLVRKSHNVTLTPEGMRFRKRGRGNYFYGGIKQKPNLLLQKIPSAETSISAAARPGRCLKSLKS